MMEHALVLLLLLGPMAAGADWFVDARRGDDQTGDGSPTRPWRTLTRALEAAPRPGPPAWTDLWIASGRHDPALGERFPLRLPPRTALHGAGADYTVISGGATVLLEGVSGAVPAEPDPRVRVEGLAFVDGAIGISVDGTYATPPLVEARRCLFLRNQTGIACVRASARVEECEFREQNQGVAFMVLEEGRPAPAVRRSLFDGGVFGVTARNVRGLEIEGCRFQRFGSAVLLEALGAFGEIRNRVAGCVLTANEVGVRAQAVLGGALSVSVLHDTLWRNDVGIVSLVSAATGASGKLEVVNTVVWESRVADLYGVEGGAVRHCIFRTQTASPNPAPIGLSGNRSLDPGLQDPEGGDFHLTPGSPALDAGTALSEGVPARDLDGEPRAVGYPDIGADEWGRFLRAEGAARPGGIVRLRLWSPRDPFLPYVLGLSLAGPPGAGWGDRRLPIVPDALFARSLVPGFLLDRPLGLLDEGGEARADLRLPACPELAGTTLHAAFATLAPGAPGFLQTLSNGLPLPIER